MARRMHFHLPALSANTFCGKPANPVEGGRSISHTTVPSEVTCTACLAEMASKGNPQEPADTSHAISDDPKVCPHCGERPTIAFIVSNGHRVCAKHVDFGQFSPFETQK